MNFESAQEININSESDIITTRKIVRDVATSLGFGITDVTRIVTTASELTRNIFIYAGSGILQLHRIDNGNSPGIELIFKDNGPGITDVELAMEAGYSTCGGLGLGLPGSKRLMDEMEIQSEVGKGTVVTVRKWLNKK